MDRAKCLLIECCGMTEPEAHSYIEQQAMNQRRSSEISPRTSSVEKRRDLCDTA